MVHRPTTREKLIVKEVCVIPRGSRTWGYLGAVPMDKEDRVLRPASVYWPKNRTVAMPSKVTGIHIYRLVAQIAGLYEYP
jgi:hypothetical protein